MTVVQPINPSDILPLSPSLPAEVLAKRDQLPLKPTPVILTGRYVQLVPFDMERDLAALYAVSNGSSAVLNNGSKSVEAYDADAIIWRFMFAGPFDTLEAFRAYMQMQVDAKDGLPLMVLDLPSKTPIGIANYMSNSPVHLKIELGSIWYSPLAQGTHANTEATYLMLGHAFDLGYRRVEWKCNTLNERSKRVAARMGFRFEGIQESHFIIKGRNRDTAWFRILDREWAEVKQEFQKRLYNEN